MMSFMELVEMDAMIAKTVGANPLKISLQYTTLCAKSLGCAFPTTKIKYNIGYVESFTMNGLGYGLASKSRGAEVVSDLGSMKKISSMDSAKKGQKMATCVSIIPSWQANRCKMQIL